MGRIRRTIKRDGIITNRKGRNGRRSIIGMSSSKRYISVGTISLPISNSKYNSIINRIEVGEDAPAPKTIYEPGEVVRVCDGPFNDFNGVVENVDYERNMVKVAVQILGRATPVDLEFIQIEKT